ncbi:DUF1289 domain-containing protein [Azospirillum doebereinerae]|uniref:DUF1289 domain-containing protein n=1 Tax=Azospirillum doebereinerae TaxID=92933 RepID=A0A3S0V7E7_9PROT|nr:DUF1289 domain-containing protein [Azospirillum doebereinerae]RUQ73664.1 DUF1289 domain-containing protein [Azospirillum doebereinerae]
MTIDESTVPSPCVRQCTLNDDDVCLGCFRSLDEIKDWSGLDAPAKRAVLAEAGRRRAGIPAPRWNWTALRPRG